MAKKARWEKVLFKAAKETGNKFVEIVGGAAYLRQTYPTGTTAEVVVATPINATGRVPIDPLKKVAKVKGTIAVPWEVDEEGERAYLVYPNAKIEVPFYALEEAPEVPNAHGIEEWRPVPGVLEKVALNTASGKGGRFRNVFLTETALMGTDGFVLVECKHRLRVPKGTELGFDRQAILEILKLKPLEMAFKDGYLYFVGDGWFARVLGVSAYPPEYDHFFAGDELGKIYPVDKDAIKEMIDLGGAAATVHFDPESGNALLDVSNSKNGVGGIFRNVIHYVPSGTDYPSSLGIQVGILARALEVLGASELQDRYRVITGILGEIRVVAAKIKDGGIPASEVRVMSGSEKREKVEV